MLPAHTLKIDAWLAAHSVFAATPLGQFMAVFRLIHSDDIMVWPLSLPLPEPLSRKQRRALRRATGPRLELHQPFCSKT